MRRYTRRIKLPSGRVLEVTYFSTAPSDEVVRNCPKCGSEAVALGDFSLIDPESDSDLMYVHARCGECGTWRYFEATVDALSEWENEVLDYGESIIARAANRLDRARFTDQIEAFVNALNRNLIVPEDF